MGGTDLFGGSLDDDKKRDAFCVTVIRLLPGGFPLYLPPAVAVSDDSAEIVRTSFHVVARPVWATSDIVPEPWLVCKMKVTYASSLSYTLLLSIEKKFASALRE